MKTGKRHFSRMPHARLLVLVPHRDARLRMRAWSRSLFALGMPGAWSFPWAAPLAILGGPLSGGELGALARAVRGRAGPMGGRFACGPAALAPIPFPACGGRAFAFGPSLGDALVEAGDIPGAEPISPAVLGSALAFGPPPGGLPEPPGISFGAAALAVMRLRPLRRGGGGYSLEWRIGEPHWLPRR